MGKFGGVLSSKKPCTMQVALTTCGTVLVLPTTNELRIASFPRVRKLWIRKIIILIAHHYVQFVQTHLNSQCS